MGKRRSALRDVLTTDQYGEMLETAARIEDREESIALFFWLTMMGRVGLRVGEVIHMQRSWFKGDRSVIAIPPHVDCDCGLCRHYAKQWAERNNLEFEEVLEEYWKVKDESDRDACVETDRDREIIRLYFEEVPYTSVSYSTVNRRLKKVAELTDSVNPANVYPHMMRATAATHLAWAGFAPSLLDIQFGWSDEKTKEKYTKKTSWRAKLEFDRIYDRDEADSAVQLRGDPPTYEELRPDDEDELITVESWAVDTSVETHPRTRDEEPLIHDLDEFSDNATADPVTPVIQARLAREHEILKNNPDTEAYPPARRVVTAAVGMLSVALAGVTILSTTGFFADFAAGDPIALAAPPIVLGTYLPWMVHNIHDNFHENPQEVNPESLLDRIIIGTHAAVDRLKSAAGIGSDGR